VRQIIGWREYMRGIYWLKCQIMLAWIFQIKKSYQNGFGPGNQNALFKGYYKSVLNYGYTSYSAINDNRELCAFNPDELDAWYLGIYIDAIEWVEITNTRGWVNLQMVGL
jgi:deoxyribodipyrimidine photolyase-related protein